MPKPKRVARRPVVARLRQVCLALPETFEKVAWKKPTFRVDEKKAKMFALFSDPEAGLPAGGSVDATLVGPPATTDETTPPAPAAGGAAPPIAGGTPSAPPVAGTVPSADASGGTAGDTSSDAARLAAAEAARRETERATDIERALAAAAPP